MSTRKATGFCRGVKAMASAAGLADRGFHSSQHPVSIKTGVPRPGEKLLPPPGNAGSRKNANRLPGSRKMNAHRKGSSINSNPARTNRYFCMPDPGKLKAEGCRDLPFLAVCT